jgi:hypothetical protein
VTTAGYFIHQHPTGTNFERSPYYWWWEYLRRATDYGPHHRLYSDFGDLGNDFYVWWGERAAYLFAERSMSRMFVKSATNEEVPHDCVVMVVPALHPSVTVDVLVKKFRIAVKPHLGRGESTARYPVNGKPQVHGLKTTLAFYDLRLAEPHLTLYELGERITKDRELRFGSDHIIRSRDSKAVRTDKKNHMAAAVSRYIRHAKGYIKNVADGVFPQKN